jgi:addiction module HigA family antidote
MAMLTESISSNTTETEEIRVTGEPDWPPVHPGEVLGETVLPELRLTVAAAARELGISRQTLHKLIAGKISVTPEMALRLGRWCGNGPHLWLRLQHHFDLWHAERRLADSLMRIPTHAA